MCDTGTTWAADSGQGPFVGTPRAAPLRRLHLYGLSGTAVTASGLPANPVGVGGDGVDLSGQVGVVAEVAVGGGEQGG